MIEQTSIQKFLNDQLINARKKNKNYSLRAFAIKLKVSPGALSQILNGERRISKKMAERLCTQLKLDPVDRSIALKDFTQKVITKKNIIRYLKLSNDQFETISEWHHFAILSLLKTKHTITDTEQVAKLLGIKTNEAESAIDRLLRLKLIEIKNYQFVRTDEYVRTPDHLESEAVKKAHLQTLELAKKSLTEVPIEQRDFSTITFPTDPNQLSKARDLIRKFQNELTTLMTEQTDLTSVYRLSVELFPLTVSTKEQTKNE